MKQSIMQDNVFNRKRNGAYLPHKGERLDSPLSFSDAQCAAITVSSK